MAYIFEQNVGKHKYIYEIIAFRDKNGNARQHRIPIGKIDPISGDKIYKTEYIERMKKEGKPLEISKNQLLFSENDIKNACVKDFGLFYFLQKISEKLGLTKILQTACPRHFKEIFTLAQHLLTCNEPEIYVKEWLESTETLDCGNLSSQNISRLLSEISFGEREKFYELWCKKIREDEYLALDITSCSSYSELISEVEWGYNRDKERLPQINLCMLVGEKSRLPVYQTAYSGSLKDVSTLRTTLAKFKNITEKTPTFVTDKGFFSKKNIDVLLDDEQHFVISVPFSSNFAKKQVENERETIDCFENFIEIGEDTLRGVTKKVNWNGTKSVYSHVFFNPKKAISAKEEVMQKVNSMLKKAKSAPKDYFCEKEYQKFLIFTKKDDTYEVFINLETVENARKTAGWLVIITDRELTAEKVLQIYRDKDVVEKGFDKLKNSLELGRLRVHSSENMESKLFIGFIALILMSYISKIMYYKLCSKKLTLKQLLRSLAKIKLFAVKNDKIISPVSKLQVDIYSAFEVVLHLSL